MADIRDKAHGDRNWVERILHHVPGFSGYLGKEERRETDKLLRMQLATRLDQIRKRLDPLMRDLTDGGGLAAVGEVDRVKKAIGRVADRIRTLSYGYSGMFDVVKIREAELDRLYEFDVALVERINALEDASDQLRSGMPYRAGVGPMIQKILAITREFDEQIDLRSQLITGYQPDDSSGR